MMLMLSVLRPKDLTTALVKLDIMEMGRIVKVICFGCFEIHLEEALG